MDWSALRGGMDQFAAERYAQKLCIRYVSGLGNYNRVSFSATSSCSATVAGGQGAFAKAASGDPTRRGEAEQAAVEDGVAAYEHLLSKLADVPTPAGPTPHEIGARLVQITSFREVAMPVT